MKWILGIVTLISGSFFHFISNNSLRAWGLTLGLRHNDHVIIGSILLIIAFVCLYRIVLNRISSGEHQKKVYR